MTEPDLTPDWDLLPHSPLAFFGLATEFGRKDLKRSYNRLIRKYKPEKFPQEFQRIRGAYEQLDNQLRYGFLFSQETVASDPYEWKTDTSLGEQETIETRNDNGYPEHQRLGSEQDSVEAEGPTSNSRRLPLHERIQHEPPTDVYRILAKKTNKTAYDYYALAVMSDIVHRKDGLQFVRWILAGVKAHPSEQGLYSLLYEYYRGPISDSAIPDLLIATSKIVAENRFFAMTESLWLRMLRTHPFQQFRTTLEQCETNLQGIDIDGRLAFLIEILKAAIWKADGPWIEETMTLIDENFERIPFHLQFDVDILELLKKYVAHRDTFLSGHPLRRKIDHAIQTYFSEDQRSGDQSVLECQIEIAQDSISLLEAFPYDNGEDYEPLFLVWSTLSEDVAERNVATLEEERDSSIWVSRVHALLVRIQTATNLSLLGTRWTMADWAYRCAIGMMYFFIVVMLTLLGTVLTVSIDLSPLVIPLVILVVTIFVGGAMARWLHTKVLSKYWHRYCQRKSSQCYRSLWQQEMLAFIERSHLSYFELRELFFVCNIAELSYANWAIGHYQQDYTMAFYSTAQRFLI